MSEALMALGLMAALMLAAFVWVLIEEWMARKSRKGRKP